MRLEISTDLLRDDIENLCERLASEPDLVLSIRTLRHHTIGAVPKMYYFREFMAKLGIRDERVHFIDEGGAPEVNSNPQKRLVGV